MIELNRAAAVAMRDGPEAGLRLIDAILDAAISPTTTSPTPPERDLCRRLGRRDEARAAYERALALARQGPERRFLEKRVSELGPS